jgi:AcrR family transcriptional regulator
MSCVETKKQIIKIASQLFGKYGYYKTSIDNVAKMSRKAKGSIYYHFDTKEILFTEVVALEIEQIKQSLLPIVNDEALPADLKLKQFLKQRMYLLHDAKNYHETLQADFFNEFEFLKEVRIEWDNWVKAQIKQILNQGIEEDLFEVPAQLDVLLDVFIMISKGLEIPFFLQHKYEELSPYFDDMLRMLVKGFKK